MLRDDNGDLAIEAYALTGLLIVGYEFLGLATVVYISLGLAGLGLVALLVAALVRQWRPGLGGDDTPRANDGSPPLQMGGAGPGGNR